MPSNGENQKVTQAQLKQYARLFINRTDTSMGLALAGHWTCRKQPLTGRYLVAALAGDVVLGIYAVDAEGLSRWACIDVDDDAQAGLLKQVISHVPDPGTVLLEPSRRGAHLWLFVEPSPWQMVRAWARQLARDVELDGVEVFPKGAGLNGVRAPLTPHPKNGHVYPLVDPETAEVADDPWALVESRRRGSMPSDVILPTAPQINLGGRGDYGELVAEVEPWTRLRPYGPERASGRCPFHEDRHPSFSVVGGFWRCWAGCGEGGISAFRARLREHGLI